MKMPKLPQLFPLPDVPPVMTAANYHQQSNEFSARLYRDFFNHPIQKTQKLLENTPSKTWDRAGEAMALNIFHAAAERVPAYKDFLGKQKIKHERINIINDFKAVPPINKKNYLQNYSLSDLSWDGLIHTSQIISVSSGSTGRPFFWPRGAISEIDTTYQFEVTLGCFFKTHERSTLFVNAFAMGMYVGGPITLNSVLRIAQKGHQIVIVTPGYHIEEIRRIILELGPNFDQVIIASYPPFAKDIVDDGIENGIDWKKLKTKFWLAGEGYSESWREYIAELAGANAATDLINVYGTADSTMLGHETPISNIIRRVFNQNNGVRREMFGDERLPSLLQYYPTLRYFEVLEKERLIFTSSAGIPLIRYEIKDRGGIFTYDDAERKLCELGTNISKEVDRYKYREPAWHLPFVYVFGRSDFTTVLYGANIYPENIKIALETSDDRQRITGKFTMFTNEDKQHNQSLILNIECTRSHQPSKQLERSLQKHIVAKLLELNSEYSVVYNSRGVKAHPRILLYNYGEKKYFGNQGVKQKWTLRKKDRDKRD